MKITILFCALAAAISTTGHAQNIGTKYSGRSDVPGLGTVVFPAGQWFLEFRKAPPNPNPAHRPDYFGFRKVGDTPERLGFRRYDPATAPSELIHLLDGIGEDLGQGAPYTELGTASEAGSIHPMRYQPDLARIKPSDADISFSFISIYPKPPSNWLCHAHIFSRSGWAFVVFHASTSVIDPETVEDVTRVSRVAAIER